MTMSDLERVRELKEAGRPREALAACQQVGNARPDYLDVLHLRAQIEFELGDLAAAEASCSKVLAADPGHADAYNSLGIILLAQGKTGAAAEAFQKCLDLNASHENAAFNLANILREQGDLPAAFALYQRALSRDPNHAGATINLDTTRGLIEGRISELEAALKNKRGDPASLNELGHLYCALADEQERNHNVRAAKKYASKGLRICPESPALRLAAARCARRTGQFSQAIRQIHGIRESGVQLDDGLAYTVDLELGRVHELSGDAEAAWALFESANARLLDSIPEGKFGPSFIAHVESIRDVVSPEWLKTWTEAPPEGSRESPVFLIGFPRSGTTLAGQILGSHPDLVTLDEWSPITELTRIVSGLSNGYPEALADLGAGQVEALRRQYFDILSRVGPPGMAGGVIDKMPYNIVDVPMIVRLFPSARFILMVRHPLDTCLSCFMQNFQLSQSNVTFLSLAKTAELYGAVTDLWRRHEATFQPDHIVVRYEDLVSNFEDEARKMLRFAGVGWDQRVARFHVAARKGKGVSTPSHDQVTEPLYQRAAYRWKRYSRHLEPVFEVLRPACEFFGYRLS